LGLVHRGYGELKETETGRPQGPLTPTYCSISSSDEVDESVAQCHPVLLLVILSEAKDLTHRAEILRFAQDDKRRSSQGDKRVLSILANLGFYVVEVDAWQDS